MAANPDHARSAVIWACTEGGGVAIGLTGRARTSAGLWRATEQVALEAVAQDGALVQVRRDARGAPSVQRGVRAPVNARVLVVHRVITRVEHEPIHRPTHEVTRMVVLRGVVTRHV